MNSRDKGKRGELELVHYLKSKGVEARRGQQFSGANGDPDVIASGPLDGFHIEVKRREKGNVYEWVKQATADAKPEDMPVVFHRKNDEEWLTIMRAEDFMFLLFDLQHYIDRSKLP